MQSIMQVFTKPKLDFGAEMGYIAGQLSAYKGEQDKGKVLLNDLFAISSFKLQSTNYDANFWQQFEEKCNKIEHSYILVVNTQGNLETQIEKLKNDNIQNQHYICKLVEKNFPADKLHSHPNYEKILKLQKATTEIDSQVKKCEEDQKGLESARNVYDMINRSNKEFRTLYYKEQSQSSKFGFTKYFSDRSILDKGSKQL